MSSILDALNKIEKEESRLDYPLTRARAGKNAFTSKIAVGIVGIVCLCIGAIGLSAYYRKSAEKTPQPLPGASRPVSTSAVQKRPQTGSGYPDLKHPSASAPKIPAPLVSGPPDPKTATARTVSRPETRPLDNMTEKEAITLEDGGNDGQMEADQRPDGKTGEDLMEEAVAGTVSRGTEMQAVSGEKDTSDVTAESSTALPAQIDEPLPMDRLEGVGFKIQAISWGEAPRERLVVIGNQVLREGDGLEGYRISRINPDDIVLRRGDNTYRLEFGLKSGP